jgi:hypothetical protein
MLVLVSRQGILCERENKERNLDHDIFIVEGHARGLAAIGPSVFAHIPYCSKYTISYNTATVIREVEAGDGVSSVDRILLARLAPALVKVELGRNLLRFYYNFPHFDLKSRCKLGYVTHIAFACLNQAIVNRSIATAPLGYA